MSGGIEAAVGCVVLHFSLGAQRQIPAPPKPRADCRGVHLKRVVRASDPTRVDGHRSLSALLVLTCAIALLWGGDIEAIVTLGPAVFCATALVWYPEELGSLTGIDGMVDRTSPASFVRFFGWLFLLAGVVACVAVPLAG